MPIIRIVVDNDLLEKVQDNANKMGHTLSSFGRYVLTQWCDADRETLRLNTLIDTGTEYEEDSDD